MVGADLAGGHAPVGQGVVGRAVRGGEHRTGRAGAGIQVGQVLDNRRLPGALAAVVVGAAALGGQQRVNFDALDFPLAAVV